MASTGYVCDTIPAARLAAPDDPLPFGPDEEHDEPEVEPIPQEPVQSEAPPPRKLCVRHQRMADEGTNLKLQQVRGQKSSQFNDRLTTYISPVTRCIAFRGA